MKKIINRLLSNKLVLSFLSPLIKLSDRIRIGKFNQDLEAEKHAILNKYKKHFEKKTVLAGPFEGMQYPNYQATGSTFFPKLIGSYEAEIHPFVDKILGKKYSEIWDVGCAEGYYAIGFAMKNESCKVQAFDIDPVSQSLCKEMAVLNNVSETVTVKGECNADMINQYEFQNGLIFSDCEGAEYDLLKNVKFSEKNLDYLIEIHEWPLDFNMELKIRALFETTHNLTVIKSTSDLYKAKHYDFYPLGAFNNTDLDLRYNCFKEMRGGNEMLWFYLEKK